MEFKLIPNYIINIHWSYKILPVISKNLSHCDCQKSPDAPQNRCKCLAGKSNGSNIDIIYSYNKEIHFLIVILQKI